MQVACHSFGWYLRTGSKRSAGEVCLLRSSLARSRRIPRMRRDRQSHNLVRQVALVIIARQPWTTTMTLHTGRHFLQIPGPTNVPDRVLRAMDRPVIDHRGPEFAELGAEVLAGLRP